MEKLDKITEHYAVAKRLCGIITPCGEETPDKQRLENLTDTINLVNQLIYDIIDVAKLADTKEKSINIAGIEASNYLESLYENLSTNFIIPCDLDLAEKETVKKIYVDTETFKPEEVEINKVVSILTDNILEFSEFKFKNSNLTPTIVCPDKKSLCFGLSKRDTDNTNYYRITVEKVESI